MALALPVEQILDELKTALHRQRGAILSAPPGAGKSTRVPLALLEEPWCAGMKWILLEPRRLAARSVAGFMASQLGEESGQTVGYRTRMDTRVSSRTRLEVVTEGVLTRMLLSDPALEGVAGVIFDEFHERSLNADLGLALVQETRGALREDLRLLVMSATLDIGGLQDLLRLPVIESAGRAYPVEVVHQAPAAGDDWREHCCRTVAAAQAAQSGVTLVFLPGRGEIEWVRKRLSVLCPQASVDVLYGGLTGVQQQRVLQSGDSERVVLATNVAETSITLDGVSLVVDAGLARVPAYDPVQHRTRLVLQRISRASAAQRAGRAGRQGPGRCIRLWPEPEILAEREMPEIKQVGLDALVLTLAEWGCRDPQSLDWLDLPPKAAWASACERLQAQGALGNDGAITERGKAISRLGMDPQLAGLVLASRDYGMPLTGARVAALVAEREPGKGAQDLDLRARLEAYTRSPRQFPRTRRQVQRLVESGAHDGDEKLTLGELLALVFPGQLARLRHADSHRYQLSSGPGVQLPANHHLVGSPWLLVLDTNGQPQDARIWLAAALTEEEVETAVREHGEWSDSVLWDDDKERVVAWQELRLGELLVRRTPIADPPPEQVEQGLLEGIRARGLTVLPWTNALRQWQARAVCMASLEPAWPAMDDAALLADLEQWLLPFLAGLRRLRDLDRVPLREALGARLGHGRQAQMDLWLPATIRVPSGREVALDYSPGSEAILAVKLQELFGLEQLPRLAEGRVPLVAHLLTPAGRPAAITSDLGRFWRESYAQVRKDLRGRYPKHPWPEDPVCAEATSKTKRQQGLG